MKRVAIVVTLAFMGCSLGWAGESLRDGPAPAPTGVQVPVIVAQGSLVNQTASIPMTTILTPATSGLFRISVYGIPTATDGSYSTTFPMDLYYSDDSGPYDKIFTFLAVHTGCNLSPAAGNTSINCNYTSVFRAVAGVPIQYDVQVSGQVTYDLFFTVERLQ